MANELTLTTSLTYNKGAISVALAKSGLQFNVAGTAFTESAATVPTSATAIPLGSVGTPGFILAINLDTTNYVTILDSVSGNACVKLKPGEPALFRLASSAPAWKANTASCTVLYLIIPD